MPHLGSPERGDKHLSKRSAWPMPGDDKSAERVCNPNQDQTAMAKSILIFIAGVLLGTAAGFAAAGGSGAGWTGLAGTEAGGALNPITAFAAVAAAPLAASPGGAEDPPLGGAEDPPLGGADAEDPPLGGAPEDEAFPVVLRVASSSSLGSRSTPWMPLTKWCQAC